jgi:hypothetical protein
MLGAYFRQKGPPSAAAFRLPENAYPPFSIFYSAARNGEIMLAIPSRRGTGRADAETIGRQE